MELDSGSQRWSGTGRRQRDWVTVLKFPANLDPCEQRPAVIKQSVKALNTFLVAKGGF